MGNCATGQDSKTTALRNHDQQNTLKVEIFQKTRQINHLKEKLKQTNLTNSQNKQQFQIAENKLKEIQNKLKQAEQQKFRLAKQQTLILRQAEQAKKKQEEFTKKFQTQSQKLKKKHEQELKALKEQCLQKQKNEKQTKLLLQKINNEKIQLQQKMDRLNRIKTNALFIGEILENQQEGKQFLIEILQKESGRKIIKTKQLYKFDPLNTTNFHQYIDKKEQLVLIIKTKYEHLFGGWSEGDFNPQKVSNKKGILFSLTNQKYYELLPSKPAITYEQEYIKFGNSQIRIKCDQQKVFSNFGINNQFYDSKGDNIRHFTGVSTREAGIEGYQIFQLFFERD